MLCCEKIVYVIHILQIVFINNGCVLSSSADWSISGNCPEPQPISYSYREVRGADVYYTCVAGAVLQDGDRVMKCDGTSYVGTWPECRIECGTPVPWSWASPISIQGTELGDVARYTCDAGNETVWHDARCRETGWREFYPDCPAERNLAEEMVFVVGDTELNPNTACAFTHGSGSSVGLVMQDPDRSLFVSSFRFTLHPWLSSSWLNNAYILFMRGEHPLHEATIPTSPSDTGEIEVALDPVLKGVSALYIISTSDQFIGVCNVSIEGNLFEGGCPDPVPPFATELQGNQSQPYAPKDFVYFQCREGLTYIGGSWAYSCGFSRVWREAGNAFMECTDRTNHALHAAFSVRMVSGEGSPSGVAKGLEFNGTLDSTDSMVTVPGHASHVTLTISLRREVSVERITLKVSGDQVPKSVRVFFDEDDAAGKNCTASSAYQYWNSYTFICNTYPAVRMVEVGIDADSATASASSWNVTSLAIIGEVSDEDVSPLECYNEGNGSDYRGTRSVTVDGDECLPWVQYDFDINNFPDRSLEDVKNFCRNPDPQNQANIFCMTATGPKPCPVPPCDRICATHPRADNYVGHVNTSETSVSCMAWSDDDIPFSRDSDFPDGSTDAAGHSCRNPGLSQSRPWCYVSSDPLLAQHCSIPPCPTTSSAWDSITSEHAEEYALYVKSKYTFRCFAFDKFSGTTGKSAWIDVTYDMTVNYCIQAGPGAKLYLVCAEQATSASAFSWLNWVAVCPSSTTSTTTTPPSTTSTSAPTTTKTSASTGAPMTSGTSNDNSVPTMLSAILYTAATTITAITPHVLPPLTSTYLPPTLPPLFSTYQTSPLIDQPAIGSDPPSTPAVLTSTTQTASPSIQTVTSPEPTPPPVTTSTSPYPPVTTSTSPNPPVTISTSPSPPVTISTSPYPPVTTSTSPSPPVTISTPPNPPVTTSTPSTSPNHPVSTSTSPNPPVTTSSSSNSPVSTSTSPNPPVTISSSPKSPVTTSTSFSPPVTMSTSPNPPVTTSTSPNPPITTSTSTSPPVTTSTSPNPPVSTSTSPNPPATTTTSPNSPVTTSTPSNPSTSTSTTPESTSSTPPPTSTPAYPPAPPPATTFVPTTTTTTPTSSASSSSTTDTSPAPFPGGTTTLTISTTTFSSSSSSFSSSFSSSSSSSSSPTTTQATTPPETEGHSCSCHAATQQNLTVAAEKIESIKEELVKELTVDKTSLSSTVRAKTSAKDDRQTAVTTGYVGVAMLLAVMVIVVLPDAIVLVLHVHSIICRRGLV